MRSIKWWRTQKMTYDEQLLEMLKTMNERAEIQSQLLKNLSLCVNHLIDAIKIIDSRLEKLELELSVLRIKK